ncbi:alpha-2-macroglobulin family protein [Chitinophaga vietnamensis]|uniref:alpha-2-macroglobulin family protein n=1 Tax=Chitinophaga vietnamensis TaxID=2593957 RepID=UPI001178B3F3|nr:alpha-2-macroglobulin family protein [Chitinophaga vietnamensis]
MRSFISIVIVLIISTNNMMAQSKYTGLWNAVAKEEKNGLPKSALKIVNEIYDQAVKDKNEGEQLKALIHQLKYTSAFSDSSVQQNLEHVSKEITRTSGIQRAVLQSLRGEMLWNYLMNNRYRLYNLTTIANDEGGDITTWTASRLNREITAAYQASLEPAALLKKTDYEPLAPVIDKGKNTDGLWPSLYDLLAHRALDYYKSGESTLQHPANQFELDDPAAFAPAATFASHHFKNTDSASLQYRALLLFQELLSTHEKNGQNAALLEADKDRISYMKQISVAPEHDELYEKALSQMMQTYSHESGVAEIMAMLAGEYFMKGRPAGNEHPGNAEKMRQAKALAEKAIAQYPGSYGAIQASNLLYTINSKSLDFSVEKVNVPEQPFRLLVKYTNINKVYLRLLPLNDDTRKALLYEGRFDVNNKTISNFLKSPSLKTWDQPLPDPQDYLPHSTEIKVDALPVGQYFLLVSNDPSFSSEKNLMTGQLLSVSNISYIHNGKDAYALDRSTGAPLAGARLDLWTYDIYQDKKEPKLIFNGNTNKDGSIHISTDVSLDYYSVLIRWTNGKDSLYITDNDAYLYHSNEAATKATPKPQTFLFTDRSIYRPGQTLYFKGIVLQKDKDGNGSKPLEGFTTNVLLYDANYQKVAQMVQLTNEYGSYSGKFTLPEGRLNGEYRLVDEKTKSEVYFSVEEYKRPKFEVKFDTVKLAYRLGDTVITHAKALAYAGNNIDGATVKYRVERRVRFPYPWLTRGYIPYGSSREITSGTTTTAADGSFSVRFPALPDRTINPATKPIFTYVVTADVTDINGETRSGSQDISAGYQSLEIEMAMPAAAVQKDIKQAHIQTRNLNGAFVPVTMQLQLKPVQPGKRLLRPRYWPQPDQFVMAEEEYVKLFPKDIYKDEDKQDTWPRGASLYQKEVVSTSDGKVALDLPKLAPGLYELQVNAKDDKGDTVQQRAVFEIINPDIKELPYPSYLWKYISSTSVQPGETATILLGSSAKDIHLVQALRRQNAKEQFSVVDFSGTKKFDVKATEQDRGGISTAFTFVKDSRVFSINETIAVPWDSKDLQMKLAAHRNKLEPGEKEQWSIQITGHNGDKAAAELLATMYDASLDAFRTHDWQVPGIYPYIGSATSFAGLNNFDDISSVMLVNGMDQRPDIFKERIFPSLNLFGWSIGQPVYRYGNNVRIRGVASMGVAPAAPAPSAERRMMKKELAVAMVQADDAAGAKVADTTGKGGESKPVNEPTAIARKDFRETAFFFPALHTDKDGNVTFGFTMPEALTKWKFLGLAHTKELAFGYQTADIVTQKTLMVQPNAPRFLREGDKISFSAKVSNLSDTQLIGHARLELLDAATMQPVDGWFQNIFPVQHFTAKAGQSAVVNFPLQIPNGFASTLLYRITAQAGNFSDGEENALPVLTNRMLVTESMPLAMRGDGKEQFTFTKLLHSGESQTLQQHAITVEYTSNPAWYAVQALPYLMQFPYECAEQVFNRYYANALATHIVATVPAIKTIFDKWKTTDTAALLSNLQKNEELKSLLLQQTPWVLEAKNEAERKHNIALLFDLNTMDKGRNAALKSLKEKQLGNGAFPWFSGMWEDRYITQYILAGIGHLQQIATLNDPDAKAIAKKAIGYLDQRLVADYKEVQKAKNKNADQLSQIQVHYLYARSFFNEPMSAATRTAMDYYLAQEKKHWLTQSKFAQGMIAITLFKNDDKVTPTAILKSLKENAMNSKEMGMYWKDITGGYDWYQAPIETQALLIEAFDVVGKDANAVADMKTWLLKNKQTNNWHTTKATADACYAMLLHGSNWLAATPQVHIQLGNETISSATESTEAGTGYLKTRIDTKDVKPAMGNISVTVKDSKGQPSWGAVYWQYFEQLDKITAAKTPLVIEKELFREVNSDQGPVLTKITEGHELKIGDKVKVRIVLRTDRSMEYIHLKDMRAACFEPANVISAAKWQNGLSYYESTRDASTDFFFSYLPKGTYVFEYTLFTTHEGKFSNGISTAQCMYAPEFSAHSEGLNFKVAE